MYNFYIDTSNKKWGRAYLNKEFFKLLNDNFRNKILLIFAEQSSNNRQCILLARIHYTEDIGDASMKLSIYILSYVIIKQLNGQ